MVSLCSRIRISCARVCARVPPRGKKNIKLSNQGATDRAFGSTREPNGCVGRAVAEPSWKGFQLSAGQASLCPHSIHPRTLTVEPCESFGSSRSLFQVKTGKKINKVQEAGKESQFEMLKQRCWIAHHSSVLHKSPIKW